MAVTRVYIVRHGETEDNRRGIIQGQLDSPLNPDGIEQARLVAKALRAVPFDAAFSSDLSRASRTAEIILKDRPEVPFRKQAALRERYMGELQGKLYGSKLNSMQQSTMEPPEMMAARTMAWWKDTILTLARTTVPRRDGTAANVLVVSHGGFIGLLVRGLLQSQTIKGVQIGRCLNTSVSIIEVQGSGEGRLVKYADVSHLVQEKKEVVQNNADEQGLDAV